MVCTMNRAFPTEVRGKTLAGVVINLFYANFAVPNTNVWRWVRVCFV